MMWRGLPAIAVLALAAGNASARDAANLPPFRASGYPLEIRQALSYGPEECKRQGGGKVTFAPDTVRKVDLNGDGREDYIVSFADTACHGRQAVYCGTGGCSLDIYVSLANGKQRNVFSDRVRSYEILPGKGPRTIRFELHGMFCGGSGNPSCVKEHPITDKPFVFKEPKD